MTKAEKRELERRMDEAFARLDRATRGLREDLRRLRQRAELPPVTQAELPAATAQVVARG